MCTMTDDERRSAAVGALAADRTVEQMVLRITCARELDQDRRDLCQMVYELLLTYDREKILDLADSGHLTYFIARVIRVQWYGRRSTFDNLIRHRREIPVDDMENAQK